MNNSTVADNNKPDKVTIKQDYHSPHLILYGVISELTDNMAGTTGCDSAYPSYTAYAGS